MSFREMRNFTEIMRALGYPRLISMENFRSPNFRLVAEILRWLTYRFDPNADLPFTLDNEQDRVIFIKTIAQFMLVKTHVRLNTKKLYQADGYAVKEMLKLTSLLYQATNQNREKEESEAMVTDMFDYTKIREVAEARRLATQITSKGAVLYDLFAQEVDLREERRIALGRSVDLHEVEHGIRGAIRAVEGEIKKFQQGLENIAADEANLDAKIEKKQNEVERNKKRLLTLQSVRPAYMDEYEELEEELQTLYSAYLSKFRNLSYLESMYEELVYTEKEKNQEKAITMKALSEQIRDNEHSNKQQFSAEEDELGGLLDDDDDEEGGGLSDDDLKKKPIQRNTAAALRQSAAANTKKGFGGMELDNEETDSDLDDDDDDIDDDDDDDDNDVEDNDNEEQNAMSSLDPDDARAAMMMMSNGGGGRSRPTRGSRRLQEDSDDDF